MAAYVMVGGVSDFPENEVKMRIVQGEQVAVVNAAGRFHAFSGFCTHIEVPLRGSYVEGRWLWCWLHYSVFDLETGACVDGPARDRPLSVYSVRVEGEEVFVSLEAGETGLSLIRAESP
jgi:nitrite reductase/ring-hydroxylating ferredoxin subunit